MGREGSVLSIENAPETDEVEVIVRFSGHRRFLGFLSVSCWFEVEPRDELTAHVTAELHQPQGEAWFPLGGYAEACEMTRTRHEQ